MNDTYCIAKSDNIFTNTFEDDKYIQNKIYLCIDVKEWWITDKYKHAQSKLCFLRFQINIRVLFPYPLYLTTFIYSYFSSVKYFLPLSQQDIESGKINAKSHIFDNIFHYPLLLLWIIKAKRENQRRRGKMESLYCCMPKKLLTIPYGVCDDQTEIHAIDLFADFYM